MLPKRVVLVLALTALAPALAAPEPTPSPTPVAWKTSPPRVWIFCGTPGDEEHHEHYEKLLGQLRSTLVTRFNVSDIAVFYGPTEEGYDGECTRETLMAELGKVAKHTQAVNAPPVWIFFIGHANAIAGGAFYNLPGPDISTHDLGEALLGTNPAASVVIFATTACSGAFLRPLSGPGRIVATANTPADMENETEYPDALADALEAPETDTNSDGFVSVTEIFLATHERVLRTYEQEDLMVKEHSLLDGNGDGRGTQRPAAIDATPASGIGLSVSTNHHLD